ncbi:hypothetical protein EPUL_004028 [Erysiphe pulchra]|uniref:Cyclin-D1-binding protein 1-like N-terminal domain-containing protein n=1 Tax=Erysiphe pulchra TaxID=225359 RepID=A0A2S4PP95_9PEZI|nr:hypothetical protein EPUL_004028 [Erysiphe pulchra]
MLVANSKTENDFPELEECINNTLKFLHDVQNQEISNLGAPFELGKENALDLAYETVDLIRAHATKLSLLVLNPPFISSAFLKTLCELTESLIPSLVHAVNLCRPTEYTLLFSREIKYRATQIIIAFTSLIKTIPLEKQILSEKSLEGKIVLAKTGIIWESCDAIKRLKRIGIDGYLIGITQNYIDLIKDASEELQEWAKEEGFDERQIATEEKNFELDTLSAKLDESEAIPKCTSSDDVDKIQQRFQVARNKLRLLVLMFQATIKRRLKTLPSLPQNQLEKSKNELDRIAIVKVLDHVLDMMKVISNLIDDLAGSFYDFDIQKIDEEMKECFSMGSRVAELLADNWEGKPDGFSAWASYNLSIIISCAIC